MQSASYRIWTRVAVFISYDDNYYPTVIHEQIQENCLKMFLFDWIVWKKGIRKPL